MASHHCSLASEIGCAQCTGSTDQKHQWKQSLVRGESNKNIQPQTIVLHNTLPHSLNTCLNAATATSEQRKW